MRGFRQRSGSVVFVHSYKSEKAAGDSHLLPASATRSNDVDSDCNGCAPAPFHMGIDGYDVLQEDGRNELHCFYGNGGDVDRVDVWQIRIAERGDIDGIARSAIARLFVRPQHVNS